MAFLFFFLVRPFDVFSVATGKLIKWSIELWLCREWDRNYYRHKTLDARAQHTPKPLKNSTTNTTKEKKTVDKFFPTKWTCFYCIWPYYMLLTWFQLFALIKRCKSVTEIKFKQVKNWNKSPISCRRFFIYFFSVCWVHFSMTQAHIGSHQHLKWEIEKMDGCVSRSNWISFRMYEFMRESIYRAHWF